jgi:RNase adaptor protein for sRNA GlmZ degradation
MLPPTIHATAVALDGRAVLLFGAPGAGKSDLALRLIDRGWRLVADDRVMLRAQAGVLWAEPPPALAGLIEVRDVGIVPEPSALPPQRVPVALAIDLAGVPQRLPDPAWRDVAGVAIPLLAIDGRGESAPLKVERALLARGLRLETGAVPADSSPPPTPAAFQAGTALQAGTASPMLIVTGMSGAGKSTALKALEDLGYEAVDNLPLGLVDTLLATPHSDTPRPLAFGIDTRTRDFQAEALVARLKALRIGGSGSAGGGGAQSSASGGSGARSSAAGGGGARSSAAGGGGARSSAAGGGIDIRLLFLDCADDELVRRFSETRRRHPLAADRPAADGIARERELTAALKQSADLVIDTTDLSATDLRRRIAQRLGREGRHPLTITIQSFGFAHGLPRNADLVFDMRFLANPHWDVALRPLTGEDAAVAAFVAADPAFVPAIDRIADLLLTLLPGYAREGKAYLTIAFGCTGGRHRSVAVSREIAARLQAAGEAPTLAHRDVGKQGSDAAVLTATPRTGEQGLA